MHDDLLQFVVFFASRVEEGPCLKKIKIKIQLSISS
jgi:hypothetical protein